MRKFIQNILHNKFVRVSGANGIITLLKSLVAMIANKVVAIYIGAPGIALVGQLQNFVGILTMISGGGFNQGLTKYIAQYKDDEKNLKEFVSTSFVFSMVLSAFCGVVTLLFSNMISMKIFLTDKYFLVIALLGITLILYNLNNLFISIVNGFQRYQKYFKINLMTSLIGALLSIILVIVFQVYGALLSIVLSQSIVCLFTWFLVKNEHWIKYFSFVFFSQGKFKLLLKYTLITLLGGVIWPVVKIIIRSYVITRISFHEAGIWEATSKINDYIGILTTGSFAIYLLPRLSVINDPTLLKREIIGVYKLIIPFCLICFIAIYVMKKYVILLLYSPDFMKVGDYLLLQMIGSFFWICKIVPMNLLLAKEKTNLYMILEISFCLMYVLLTYALVPLYGVQGIQMSFAAYNFLYLVTCLFLLKNHLLK